MHELFSGTKEKVESMLDDRESVWLEVILRRGAGVGAGLVACAAHTDCERLGGAGELAQEQDDDNDEEDEGNTAAAVVANAGAHAIAAKTEDKNKDEKKNKHEELRSTRFAQRPRRLTCWMRNCGCGRRQIRN
jgi:hypothetical protein